MLHSDERTQLTIQWCLSAQMAAPFACSFNIFYIYQAFNLLFHKALHPPSSGVPHPVFLICGLSLQFGDVGVQSSLLLDTFSIQ